MKKHKSIFTFCLVLLQSLGLLVVSQAAQPVLANAGQGAIAYVIPNDTSGDEIHLIDPDGTHDREIWHTGTGRLVAAPDVTQLAWKPDASSLAFTSSHESGCSLYQADIYAIRSDGLDYRRVSGPPACGNPDNLPTATVRVPVENWTAQSGPFTFYFEGAPGPIEMSLAPGQSTTLTFHNVADYGDQLQYAVAIYGEVRSFYPDARVDVQPGAALETGVLVIRTGFDHFGFQWPSYTLDGSKIASIFNKGELYHVESDNREPGLAGGPLPVTMPMSSDFLTWGPTAARAGQFLYEGWQDSDTIFLGDANSASSQLIMTIDPLRIGKTLLGLAWLPDGSGFLYSFTEMVNYVDKADLFEYSFATGQSKRLTDLPYGFIRRVTISPDGQKIVYEYQQDGYWYEENPAIDLWIMNRDGSQADLFVENGRSPAWSPRPLPELPPPTTPQPTPTLPPPADLPFRLMLPLIIH
jgi:hypothetical protein